jgi:hypothetical protein
MIKYSTLIPVICYSYCFLILFFGKDFWMFYLSPEVDGYESYDDVKNFMSAGIGMFLFAYSTLSGACNRVETNFKDVHRVIWTTFLLYSIYFWNFVTPFFQFSNIMSCVTVLGLMFAEN